MENSHPERKRRAAEPTIDSSSEDEEGILVFTDDGRSAGCSGASNSDTSGEKRITWRWIHESYVSVEKDGWKAYVCECFSPE
jgi:hypothetical protein